MSVSRDFKLPDLGEGLTESELVSWHVAVGDTVELNQIIAEVETAKALVELPSPFAGVVSKLYEQSGSTVAVGAPIVAFEIEDATAAGQPQSDAGVGVETQASEESEEPSTGPQPDSVATERNSVLVGYGPKVEGTNRPVRRARGRASSAPESDASGSSGRASGPVEHETAVQEEVAQEKAAQERPRSTPPVRKLARDLGVDLTHVAGTGENGVITREDLENHVADEQAAPAPGPQGSATGHSTPEYGSTGHGSAEREMRTPIKGVRKHTAAAMVASAFTAPHVSEFLTIDVTSMMELLSSLRDNRTFAGHRLNILTVVAKAVSIGIARNPSLNSRWDEATQEIVQFNYVNLGIAAATPRGLVVPNIKDADRLSLVALADALAGLTETARAGKTSPAELSGGTISITNIGVFGIDAGTPIVNPGEAAIVAMGAVRRTPWEYRGEVALRQVMTLSLSFDHRLVDGEQGSRFLADLGTILAEPGMILTMV